MQIVIKRKRSFLQSLFGLRPISDCFVRINGNWHSDAGHSVTSERALQLKMLAQMQIRSEDVDPDRLEMLMQLASLASALPVDSLGLLICVARTFSETEEKCSDLK